MNQQQKRELEQRKNIRVEYARNGYVVYFKDEHYEDSDPTVFYDLDSLLKHIKDHYNQLIEDLKISKLTE
jgi:hypothetical protein